jgi:hypothetical protein
VLEVVLDSEVIISRVCVYGLPRRGVNIFLHHLYNRLLQGGIEMAEIIDVHDLDEKDIELLQRLVERLRRKARKTSRAGEEKNGFERSAGSWKKLVDPDTAGKAGDFSPASQTVKSPNHQGPPRAHRTK